MKQKNLLQNILFFTIVLTVHSCVNNSKNNSNAIVGNENKNPQQPSNEGSVADKTNQKKAYQSSKDNTNSSNKKNNILPKPEDDVFEAYIEDVKPEEAAYYVAYNKVLTLFKTTFHEVNVKTTKGTAHVIVCGPKNGNPIVLLHGMNASSTSWYPNIQALSQNNRVYAIDNILEPGKSQLSGEIKDINEVVKWYIEVFDKLNLQSFTLIGASKGGWLSVNIALQQKYKIKNLILLSPAQTFIWIQPGSKLLSNITYKLDPKRDRLPRVLSTVSYNVDNINDAYIDQYFIATEAKPKNKFILQMRPYSDAELKTLTMPVLVLIGDHDIINNEKSVNKAKKLLPVCEAGIIKNAGHFLSIDQSEIVNKKMLDFLNSNKIISTNDGIVN